MTMTTCSQSTKKTIYLHGSLGELHPEPIVVEAATVAEAVRSLKMIPQLRPKSGEDYHRVRIEGVDTDIALYSETSMSEIHIHPLVGGAGGKPGLGQILLGIAIVAVAFMFPPAAGGLVASMGITQGSLFLMGGMMIAGGLLQMLMPVPEVTESKSSKFLGASENTVQIGTPITLAYGNNKLAGHYLSFDVDAVDYTGDAALTVGNVTLGQDNRFVRYDEVAGMAFAVVCPIYASQTPGITNVPTAGWTGA